MKKKKSVIIGKVTKYKKKKKGHYKKIKVPGSKRETKDLRTQCPHGYYNKDGRFKSTTLYVELEDGSTVAKCPLCGATFGADYKPNDELKASFKDFKSNCDYMINLAARCQQGNIVDGLGQLKLLSKRLKKPCLKLNEYASSSKNLKKKKKHKKDKEIYLGGWKTVSRR